ncbi:hypothetical protein H4R33_000228 [Dimargaris cristalligena]|nr:hypothetical protein H4R33_000228 [Dimargaris cristalligena]
MADPTFPGNASHSTQSSSRRGVSGSSALYTRQEIVSSLELITSPAISSSAYLRAQTIVQPGGSVTFSPERPQNLAAKVTYARNARRNRSKVRKSPSCSRPPDRETLGTSPPPPRQFSRRPLLLGPQLPPLPHRPPGSNDRLLHSIDVSDCESPCPITAPLNPPRPSCPDPEPPAGPHNDVSTSTSMDLDLDARIPVTLEMPPSPPAKSPSPPATPDYPELPVDSLILGSKVFRDIKWKLPFFWKTLLGTKTRAPQTQHPPTGIALICNHPNWSPVYIPFNELGRLETFLNKKPFALVLRSTRALSAPQYGTYYQPNSTDPSKSRIMCLFTAVDSETLAHWIKCLSRCSLANPDQKTVGCLSEGQWSNMIHMAETRSGHQLPSDRSLFDRPSPVADRVRVHSRSCSKEPQLVSNSPVWPPPIQPDPLLVYPFSGIKSVSITRSDTSRLRPEEYLNDTIIEFYLKYLQDRLRESNPDLVNQVHFFNSFFYSQLTAKSTRALDETCYSKVQRWTARVDLFSKKFIFIPIHQKAHWYLAVICNPGRMADPLSPIPPPKEASPQPTGTTQSPAVEDRTTPPSPTSKTPGVPIVIPEVPGTLCSSMPPDPLSQSDSSQRNDRSPTPEFTVLPRRSLRIRSPKSTDAEKSDYIILSPPKRSRGSRSQPTPHSPNSHSSVGRILAAYLKREANSRQISVQRDAVVLHPDAPFQTNSCDCGLFVLQYVESFLQAPDSILNVILNRPGTQEGSWFQPEIIDGKRTQILQLIERLSGQYQDFQQNNAPKDSPSLKDEGDLL